VWLVRRVIALILVLVVLCAGVVMITRLNPTPSRLQALGFDVCDGEPCWRGIKPGMDGTFLRSKLPNLGRSGGDLEEAKDGSVVSVVFSDTASTIDSVSLFSGDITFSLPITIGDIVGQLGTPCRAFNPQRQIIHLIYRTLTISIYMDNSADPRLEANSPPYIISLNRGGFLGGCSRASSSEKWHGLTSVAVYEAHFRRAKRSTQD
jgi:hypothetical protein